MSLTRLNLKQNIRTTFILLFLFSESIFIAYWLAFYPGILSDDSFFQFGQLNHTLPLDNWHPYIHTYWLHLLSLGTGSPAIISFNQLTLSAILYSGFSSWLISREVPVWITLFCFVGLVLLPGTGYYNITLWKDVTSAQFVTALIFLWLALTTFSIKSDRSGYILMILFAGATFMAAITRHNHNILLVAVPFVIWFFTKIPASLKVVYTLSLAFIYILSMLPIWVGAISNEARSNDITLEVAETWLLAYSYHNNSPTLTSGERQFLNTIIPPEQLTRAADCRLIYAPPTNFSEEQEERLTDIFIGELAYNPSFIITQRVCNFLSLLGLGPVQGDLLYWNYQLNTASPTIKEMTNNTHIVHDTRSTFLRDNLANLMEWSKEIPQRYIFWSHILGFIMVFVVGVLSAYYRNSTLFGIFFIYIVLIAFMFMISLSRSWRYLYYLSPFVFYSIPIIIQQFKQSQFILTQED